MGMPMITGKSQSVSGQASSLLEFLAGPYATTLAGMWPAPHTGFLTLPAARRHAAILFAYRLEHGIGELTADDIVRIVTRAKDSEVAKLLFTRPMPGLMKAMDRLGEQAWQDISDYVHFLDLFEDEATAKVLRHMKEIRPNRIRFIVTLPPVLRTDSLISLTPSLVAAEDLATAYDLVVMIHGEDAAIRKARDWTKARKAKSLFDSVVAALKTDTFGHPAPAPELPAPFERVISQKALEKVALEFQNCLRDYATSLFRGFMAVYVWRGPTPAAVALIYGMTGWRLAEALGKDNNDLPDDVLKDIVEGLRADSIRTGPPTAVLSNRLHSYGCNNCNGYVRAPYDGWRSRLELGTLWDD